MLFITDIYIYKHYNYSRNIIAAIFTIALLNRMKLFKYTIFTVQGSTDND